MSKGINTEETCYTLDQANGQAVAVHENNRNELREMEVFSSLTQGGGKPGQGKPTVRQGLSVRRLTPRECERLQGFSDDYTMISYRNKPAENCPDGPRYKALGNSMAVPVMRWIGKRIQQVEEMMGD
jgi:DNA (cytosine-5)-methyltransferase 1